MKGFSLEGEEGDGLVVGCVGVFFFFSLKVVVLFFWDSIHVVLYCFSQKNNFLFSRKKIRNQKYMGKP